MRFHQEMSVAPPFIGWSSVSNLPAVREMLAAAGVDGKLYAIGGSANLLDYQSTVYRYDPTQPEQGWLSVSSLPAARANLAAASLNGRIYAMGGYDGSRYQSTVLEYDPRQPEQGWLNTGILPEECSYLAAASVNDKLYAFGGYVSTGVQSRVYEYDPAHPAQGWLSVSELPAVRANLAAASVNGKIYAIGGDNGAVYQSTVYVYDPARQAQGWLSVSNLPTARDYLAATSAHGKIYAMGGHDGTSVCSSVHMYDPLQPLQGWVSMGDLPAARRYLAAASVGGKLYAIGGREGNTWYSTVFEGRFASGVLPPGGYLAGGNTVTISGSNLGNGDVTNVTLCGIAATILADNSPTQIVVQASAAAVGTNGDVVVRSTSYGTTVASNAYTYGVAINASAGANGWIAPSGSVYVVPGGETNFVIAASNYYHIASILTNGEVVAFANPTNVTVVWSNVAADGTIHADFAENLATNGVPEWWLHQYYPASNDFNAVAMSDTDGDRLAAWQERFAGTDPTNAASTLAISAVSNGFAISWWSVTGKYYTLSRSTNLQLGFDSNVKTNIPATPPANTEADTNAPAIGPWFYRVRVE